MDSTFVLEGFAPDGVDQCITVPNFWPVPGWYQYHFVILSGTSTAAARYREISWFREVLDILCNAGIAILDICGPILDTYIISDIKKLLNI